MGKADVGTMQVLRLHVVAGGGVWYGHDGFLAGDSGQNVSDFLRDGRIDLYAARDIRVLGTAGNADLILGLHEQPKKTPGTAPDGGLRIILGSPTLLSGHCAEDPASVLLALWQHCRPGSGNWHRLRTDDYVTYSLIQVIGAENGRVSDKALRIFRYHPAYPAFSFLRYHNPVAACRLVAAIVDPRWFRNPEHPGRINRLLNFLGANPQNMRALLGESDERGRHAERGAWLMGSWFDRSVAGVTEDPCNFLWRTCCSASEPAVGMLRACRRLVRFVHEVWLHESGENALHKECVFAPEQFFKDAAECEAYRRHRQVLSSGN